jgi:hypothetical protein
MSWGLLLRHAGPHFDWRSPLTLTWVALGLLPGKMAMVRFSAPLPAERAEEHYRFQDAARRNWIRVSGIFFGWFSVTILFSGALLHALSTVRPAAAWRWLALAISLAVWGYGMVMMFRGQRRLREMSRDLRPTGSWKSPFGRLSCLGMNREFLIWAAIWFGGILLLAFYPHR